MPVVRLGASNGPDHNYIIYPSSARTVQRGTYTYITAQRNNIIMYKIVCI